MQIKLTHVANGLITASLLFAIGALGSESGFVGAQACKSCHAEEYAHWEQSDHAKAMQLANSKTVLGDFSDAKVNFHGISSRFYQKEGRFYVETLNLEGEQQQFPITHTFGYSPLQQYLVEMDKGKLQALNVAWDSRPKEEGGQRWYHLQPDENISPEHPLFWAGHFQNWNSRCAECHVTNYQKNFSPDDLSYDSQWTDVNVACEACHGAGSGHTRLATAGRLSPKNSGFSRHKAEPITWRYTEGDAIANPVGRASEDQINMCGRCHALRTPLAENKPNANFHDSFRLQLLNQGTYFADGQIQGEVFVLGSFLQSKMYEVGVTCTDCHNPHTGKVKIEGNALCAQCHMPQVYDTAEHHRHLPKSQGAACVSCHMPARTYMGVDARRDHSFTIPRPALSIESAVPNACVGCHDDKTDQWALAALTAWGKDTRLSHWAQLNSRARNLDVLASNPLEKLVNDESHPAIVRATLLNELGQLATQESIQVAQGQLQSKDVLLRRAAVSALRNTPIALRWQLLSPHLQDPNLSVRFEIAAALAEAHPRLPSKQRAELEKRLQEYRSSLSFTMDAPSTQSNLAGLELALGNETEALAAYKKALEIAPAYVPALVNLSEFHRTRNMPKDAERLLTQALKIVPDSAAVQHAYGLHLVREKEYSGALVYLEKALTLEDAQPRHAYVYAIALDSQGKTKQAIKVLVRASKRWPNQYDLLLLLVTYMDKTGAAMTLGTYLSQLEQIAPNSPQVRQIRSKYAR